ncbi:MAG TPA: hypothetical protein VFG72_15220 [Marmoricola sp.]|nr:hypothetical protein [Marmoricola sp.]
MTPTDHGAAVFEEMGRGHEEFARLLFAEMPRDELDGLVHGLDSVLTVLRKVVPEGGPKGA